MFIPGQTLTRVQELIVGLHRNEKSARDELIGYARERFQKLASKMLRRDFTRVGRFVATDDVMQDALLRLCRALEQVTPPDAEAFHRLVALQLRRELIDLARRHFGPHGVGTNFQSDPGPRDESGVAQRAEPASPPSADAGALAEWTTFHEQAALIPNELRQRDVFDLRFYDGLAVKEVADGLAISESLVKLRWAQALAWLQQQLGGKSLPGL